MIVYLDDVRDPPSEDWVLVRTAREAIRLLKTRRVDVISLDHDLGEHAFGQGIHVVNWIERELFLYGNIAVVPMKMLIHSQNPVGRDNMKRAIESIERRING